MGSDMPLLGSGFIRQDTAQALRNEMLAMHTSGKLKSGAVRGGTEGRVRSDLMSWVSSKDSGPGMRAFIGCVDKFIMQLAGKVKELKKDGRMLMRTDAMASVYPGDGSHYIRHIDNNTKNGRVLTTLLYLNPIWEPSDGGCFKLYLKKGDVVIEPIFNRFLVFWSDSRCPHEVLPAQSLRYAMSIWYNDSAEVLADTDHEEFEPQNEAEQEQRMARVLQTLGIAN